MATNNNTARIAAIESEMTQMKSDIAEIREMLEAMAQPKAEKKTTSAKPKKESTFKQDVIVRRALRTEEEKAADRAAAIQKATDKDGRQTRELEKRLGLKANSLKSTLVSTAELGELGIKISRQDLKALKAEVRATVK